MALFFVPSQILLFFSQLMLGAVATPLTKVRYIALFLGSWLVLIFPVFWAVDVVVRQSPALTAVLLVVVAPATAYFILTFARVTYSGTYDHVVSLEEDDDPGVSAESHKDQDSRSSSWGMHVDNAHSGSRARFTERGVLARMFAFALLLASAFFALLTALLFQIHVLHLTGGVARTHWLVSYLRNYYVWNAADAIPILKVPQTLDWHDPLVVHGAIEGGLLLLYKVLLLVPLIRIAELFLNEQRRTGPDTPSE